jgi:isopenicillin N synthase-like dioxygenase
VPGFKRTFLRYLAAVENLSNDFTELVAEAFGLPSDGLAQFYGARDRIQHRSKVRRCVDSDSPSIRVSGASESTHPTGTGSL